MKLLTLFSTTALVLALTACTWVQPTEESIAVRLFNDGETVPSTCQRTGTNTSSVRDSIGLFNRSPGKVEQELYTLARQAAFNAGANAVQASSRVENGTQTFTFYRC